MQPTDPLRFAFSFLVPPRCAGCGCEPPGARDVLCAACTVQLPRLSCELCPFCALPLPCIGCLGPAAPWETVGAACVHSGAVPGLVVALKGSGSKGVAGLMAREISLSASLPDTAGFGITAVPGHPARLRATGVDHAQVLARATAELLGRPPIKVLRRTRGAGAVRQAGTSRSDRLREGRILISCVERPPANCLLIDDVHTTGASLAASAAALLGAGSKRVVCMTFARTLPPSPDSDAARTW